MQDLERVMGIEPTPSAWKAEVLPLNYTRESVEPRQTSARTSIATNNLVEGGGFEPPKAEPSDLQSDPFDRSGTPPNERRIVGVNSDPVNRYFASDRRSPIGAARRPLFRCNAFVMQPRGPSC